MSNTKQKKVERLVLLSMFSALILAMTFIPYVGYITIPAWFSITTLHIVVIIGAVTLGTYSSGTILGAVWGITCLLYAISNGTADAAIFMDPRISVIPRIFVGLFIVAFYKLAVWVSKSKSGSFILRAITLLVMAALVGLLFYNITTNIIVAIIAAVVAAALLTYLFFFYNKSADSMPILFAALCGTFTNTALVLTAISLFAGDGIIKLTGTIKNIFDTIIALNGSIEIVAAAVIALPCCLALKRFKR